MSERLYQQLERHYRSQGYEVRGLYSESGDVPPIWQKCPPHLLLQKQGKTTAIYRLKTIDELREHLPSCRRLLADSNAAIRFLVESPHDLAETRRWLNEVGLSCEVALVHKAGRRGLIRLATPRGGWWKAAIFLLLLVLASLLVWMVTAFYGYSPSYYEPKDLERKIKEWKQK